MPRPRGDGIKRLTPRSVAVALAPALFLLTGACSGSGTSSIVLAVAAPAAMRVPFLEARSAIMARHPGWRVDFDFLAEMPTSVITAGRPDVVATGDDATMAQLFRTGFVEAPRRFAADALQIAVQATNAAKIRSVSDLSRSGVRVAVADPSSPTGQETARVVAAEHLDLRMVTVGSPAAALELVVTGAAGAAFVETSDFISAPPGMSEVPITPANLALVTYQLAVVAHGAHVGPAQALANELLGPVQVDLRAHGFLSS
jgi:molybdate transport system substrate-binding protein